LDEEPPRRTSEPGLRPEDGVSSQKPIDLRTL